MGTHTRVVPEIRVNGVSLYLRGGRHGRRPAFTGRVCPPSGSTRPESLPAGARGSYDRRGSRGHGRSPSRPCASRPTTPQCSTASGQRRLSSWAQPGRRDRGHLALRYRTASGRWCSWRAAGLASSAGLRQWIAALDAEISPPRRPMSTRSARTSVRGAAGDEGRGSARARAGDLHGQQPGDRRRRRGGLLDVTVEQLAHPADAAVGGATLRRSSPR